MYQGPVGDTGNRFDALVATIKKALTHSLEA